mgnify:FL=1
MAKQGKGSPYSLFDEVALLLAYKSGKLVGTKQNQYAAVTEALLSFLHEKCSAVMNEMNLSGDMTEKQREEIEKSIAEWSYENE